MRNWFIGLLGFEEVSPVKVRENLILEGTRLTSKGNGSSFECGTLEIPTLNELRARSKAVVGISGMLFGDLCRLCCQAWHSEQENNVTALRKRQDLPPALGGWRQRAFVVTGAVIGLVSILAAGFVTRKMNIVSSILIVVIYAFVVIPFALFLWHATRRVRCPQCKFKQARLVYDQNRNEYVACTDCGYYKATGYSQAND